MDRRCLVAGRALRSLRTTQGLTMRSVVAQSTELVVRTGNRRYQLTLSILSNTERHGWVPHIFALAAMARIYKRRLTSVLQLYGVVLGPFKPAPIQLETAGNRSAGALNPVQVS
jgi:hypothetical protein